MSNPSNASKATLNKTHKYIFISPFFLFYFSPKFTKITKLLVIYKVLCLEVRCCKVERNLGCKTRIVQWCINIRNLIFGFLRNPYRVNILRVILSATDYVLVTRLSRFVFSFVKRLNGHIYIYSK